MEFAKRNSISLYILLTFLVSWGGCLFTLGPIFLSGESLEIEDLLLPGIFIILGPFISGLVMTCLTQGREGIRNLSSRMLKWKVKSRWYAPLLIFPVLLFSTAYILSLFVSPELSPTFFAPGILMGLIAGLFEEVGWMGFAYPAMRKKMSVFRATMLLGLVHAVWHFLPDFLNNSALLGWHWFPYFAGFFVFIIPLRILIVWVYENTESLFLAQLMHASSTGFYGILIPMELSPPSRAMFYCVYAVLLSLAAVFVVFKYGKNLGGQEEQAQ